MRQDQSGNHDQVGARAVLLPFGRHRHARALARWRADGVDGALPALKQADGSGMLLLDASEAAGELGRAHPALAAALRGRSAAIGAAAAPLTFRWEDGAGQYRGLLLPYADRSGAVRAVRVVFDLCVAAARAVPPEGRAALEAAIAGDVRPPPRSPWGHATAPGGQPAPAATSREERIAEARTWAALAAANPAFRASGLDTALEIAARLLREGYGDRDALVATIFTPGFSPDQRARLAGRLARAETDRATPSRVPSPADVDEAALLLLPLAAPAWAGTGRDPRREGPARRAAA